LCLYIRSRTGNGRIHRFLIHQELASSGFTPHQMLFRVSAIMMRDRSRYDEILEGFCQSISPYIDYEMYQDGSLVVNNQTAHLYRFWDATRFAEYLYDCVAETIRTDLREEIGFLKVFDAAIRVTMDIVDMPDRRASLLVRLILQNNGRLSQTNAQCFPNLRMRRFLPSKKLWPLSVRMGHRVDVTCRLEVEAAHSCHSSSIVKKNPEWINRRSRSMVFSEIVSFAPCS
jgi:hypothetical protein